MTLTAPLRGEVAARVEGPALRSFSAMRAFTSFFKRAADGGLSTGKRMVPLDVGKSLSSFLNAFSADRLPGNKLQWFENAANPISIPLYLNIGIR